MPNDITILPGVYYDEEVTYELTGEGSKIPVFIGKTGNTIESQTSKYKVDGTEIIKFTNITDVLKPVKQTGDDWKAKTGIINGELTYDNNGKPQIPAVNELAQTIYDFYEESKLLQSGDVGVPYIYVIDIGTATDETAWVTALDNAKGLFDATVEVYVGGYIDEVTANNTTTRTPVMFKNNSKTFTLVDFLSGASYSLRTEAKDLNLRYGFTTLKNSTDEDLKETVDLVLNAVDESEDHYLKDYSRIGLVEYKKFGKIIARICCTPNNREPGYYKFRTISPETFDKRTKTDMLALQNKGIIFGRDEHINGQIYPKINLCTSIAFASDTRPADSMFHARFNADDLLREIFEACYPQVKANESATNIAYLQTRINKIVNDRVTAEEMIKYDERKEIGTKLTVSVSDDKPYSLIVSGQIHPVKCTIAIEVEATIRL